MKASLKSVRCPRPLLVALAGSAAVAACGPSFTSSGGPGLGAASAGASAGSAAPASSGSGSFGGTAGTTQTADFAGDSSNHAGSGGAPPQACAPPLPAGGGGSPAGGGTGGKGAAGEIGGTGAVGGTAGAGVAGLSGGGIGGWSPCTPASLIDDMEDGNDRTCPNEGRNGEWWTSTGTTTGTIDPPKVGDFPAYPLLSDARVRSNYGMRLSGVGFGHTDADWASLGFNLIDNAAYDLSAYQGLSFYAKSKAGAVTIHVEFATDATTATAEGGACQTKCNDHWEKTVTLDGSWRKLSVPFATLAQEGWGVHPKDLAHTRFIYFGFAGTDGGPAAFDFLIDDVHLD